MHCKISSNSVSIYLFEEESMYMQYTAGCAIHVLTFFSTDQYISCGQSTTGNERNTCSYCCSWCTDQTKPI